MQIPGAEKFNDPQTCEKIFKTWKMRKSGFQLLKAVEKQNLSAHLFT